MAKRERNFVRTSNIPLDVHSRRPRGTVYHAVTLHGNRNQPYLKTCGRTFEYACLLTLWMLASCCRRSRS
jgi:hypothetical protein